MLADVDTDRPRDIRDRAILLLLALYGMRSGEVAALRLDQIDWAGRTLRLTRLKRRQPQIYPLLPAVAEALARYVDTVRPPSSCEEVFLCMQAPRRPLKAGSIFDVANRRFVALGIEAAECLLADTGYFSAANVAACEKAGIEPLIAMGRQPHHPPVVVSEL